MSIYELPDCILDTIKSLIGRTSAHNELLSCRIYGCFVDDDTDLHIVLAGKHYHFDGMLALANSVISSPNPRVIHLWHHLELFAVFMSYWNEGDGWSWKEIGLAISYSSKSRKGAK